MNDNADDNVVQTFQLESSNLRGRVVKLGGILDEILSPHDYPREVAHLTGEAVVMALLLSSMLKYQGVFTLQAQGDGPIGAVISDVTSDMEVRGCASYNTEKLGLALQKAAKEQKGHDGSGRIATLLGKGYLAFTVDQGSHAERYQGIVELQGESMVDCMHHYFQQSEQINTGVRMSVALRDGRWRAGAVMVQNMPEEGAARQDIDSSTQDDWRRTMVLLHSCSDEELLDSSLHSNDLLYRLFHEEGVRVFSPSRVTKGCRCTMDKLENILMMMPEDDRTDMTVDGRIVMTCEFCNQDFSFDPKKIALKLRELTRKDT